MTDQVPLGWEVRDVTKLPFPLLDAILAKVPEPRIEGVLNGSCGMSFRHADESDLASRAANPLGSSVNSPLTSLQILRYSSGHWLVISINGWLTSSTRIVARRFWKSHFPLFVAGGPSFRVHLVV